jgi:hypothetical protein
MGATWPQRTKGSRQPSWPPGAKPPPRREVPEPRRYVAARAGLSPATKPNGRRPSRPLRLDRANDQIDAMRTLSQIPGERGNRDGTKCGVRPSSTELEGDRTTPLHCPPWNVRHVEDFWVGRSSASSRTVTTKYEFIGEVRVRDLDRATSPPHRRGAEVRAYPVGGRVSDAGSAHLSQ